MADIAETAPPAQRPAAPARAETPERVRRAIAAHQARSEQLIGWLQFGVLGFFGTLYAIAPKTHQVELATSPVEIALTLYCVFTVVRLWLAYRIDLPGWFLGLSIVADIGLLCGLILSFHLQYDQPASFFLKAPTMLYIFIFIALRALRFEPLYVILTGVAAAIGWSLLVVYVVTVDPANPMITRDYVEYLTSNAVLIGAEVDKVITILVVTLILAVAIARGRRMLERAIAEETAHRDLQRFFAPEVAERITSHHSGVEPGEGEAKEAAILMIDIRGFSLLAKTMEPSELICLLAEYQERVAPAIRAEGGSIDKFLGDGVMATFGAAREAPAPAAQALRAGQAVHAAMDAWNAAREAEGAAPIRIGTAVSAGAIVFGAVGDGDRLEYTVIGDPVNRAAKLEKANRTEACRALTDLATYRAALAQGFTPETEPEIRAARPVEGMREPIDLVILG